MPSVKTMTKRIQSQQKALHPLSNFGRLIKDLRLYQLLLSHRPLTIVHYSNCIIDMIDHYDVINNDISTVDKNLKIKSENPKTKLAWFCFLAWHSVISFITSSLIQCWSINPIDQPDQSVLIIWAPGSCLNNMMTWTQTFQPMAAQLSFESCTAIGWKVWT